MQKIIEMFKNPKTFVKSVITFSVAALALILLIVSASAAINGSITNIPLFKLILTEDEIDEFEDRYDDLLDEIEEAIDDDDDIFLEAFKEEYGMSAKKFMRVMDPISLSGCKAFAKALGEDGTAITFNILIGVITGCAMFIALFLVLAIIFMNKPLAILAIVFSAGYFLAFVGFFWFLVYTALCIAYIVLVGQLKQAYKELSAPAPAPAEEAAPDAQ